MSKLARVLAVSAVVVACRNAADVRTLPAPQPADTQHVLDDDAERLNKQKRKAWREAMHRAPPGVDWRALERENGLRQVSKRNALATMAASASPWTERGSDNLAGRMHVAAPSPDGTQLYAGSSLGGLWRADLDGNGWEPLGDDLYGGVHWLAVVPGVLPADPDILLAASEGGLIHRSTDDGATWQVPVGLPGNTYGVRRVQVSADGTHTIWMVAYGTEPGGNKWSVYKSTDRGASFAKMLGLATYEGDLWTSRNGAGPLWALKSGDVKKSVDGGDTWTTVGTLPVAGTGAELTGSEAGAPRLWAVVHSGGANKLYRSEDAGASWSFLSDLSSYWGVITASITNSNLVAYGEVECWRSTNGGGSFAHVNGWGDYYGSPATKLHADIMGVDVFPFGPSGETWYVNTDGGTYESENGLASVSNLSLDGLRVSQYYSTHTSAANAAHVSAGAQDQGYQWTGDGAQVDGSFAMEQLISGDYGHLTSGDGTHAYVYSTYPGFILVQRLENNPTLVTEDFPADSSLWLPPVEADPNDNTRFFFLGRFLWRYKMSTFGFSWTETQWSTQDFQGSGGELLSALAFSPVDPDRTYAATTAGRLFHSSDHGKTWMLGSTAGPDSHYFYGSALVASALDADTAYVGGAGYGNPAVWRTLDGGTTWSAWGTGLPSTLVYCLAEDPVTGTVVCGTETSAYRRDPGDAAWTDITGDDAPVTLYWSVERLPSEPVMRFGTYGRGMWDYALEPPCSYAAVGLGIGGANVLTLDSASPTTLGSLHQLDVAGGEAGATGFLLYSAGAASLPLKGGTLLLNPAGILLVPVLADGAGEIALALPMPGDPGLAGAPLNFQVALAAGLPQGWAFSNALQGTLCE